MVRKKIAGQFLVEAEVLSAAKHLVQSRPETPKGRQVGFDDPEEVDDTGRKEGLVH
jgi:hypothetical protein